MIDRSTDIGRALQLRRSGMVMRHGQRGFLLNPYTSAGGSSGGSGANAQLMVHCNGSNGGTSFPDASPNNLTATVFGSAQTSTSQVKYGSASLKIAHGTSDRIRYNSSALTIGAGDFCIELWAYANSSTVFGNNYRAIQLTDDTSGLTAGYTNNNIQFFANTSNTWGYSLGTTFYTGTGGASTTWQHIALTRSGTTVRFFVDGVQRETHTSSVNVGCTYCTIGCGYDTTYAWDGYLDDIRITVGSPVYTSAFTPPSAELLP